jgi:hypothetical protein
MADLFTTDERVNLLFKKALNKPCTSTGREFFQEPSIVSRNYVYQEDIVSFTIPSSAPADLIGLGDTSTDDNGRALKGSYAGKTSAIDTNIKYYHKIPLEVVVGTGGSSFQAQDATTSHPGGYGDVSGTSPSNTGVSGSYGRVLRGSIPFNYADDGSYGVSLYKDTGVAIPFGSAGGGWIVDARPGVVTFFQYGNITGVGETNVPSISFYRYVGTTGGVSDTQVQAVVTATTNDFTTLQIFSGGTDGAVNDQLSAIQVDTRDVGTLATGAMLDAIQIGGNYDGSWRITVQKTSSGSQFMIQARDDGSWITKAAYSIP